MFNKQSLNPAYAGNNGIAELTFVLREQWIGLPGAPSTQYLGFSSPFNFKRAAVGLNIQRQSIGISERITLDGMYAYRFDIGGGKLSAALQASGRNYHVDFTDEALNSQLPVFNDQAVASDVINKQIFNVGFGLYYSIANYYVGFSIPRLINANIDLDSGLMASREFRHVYMIGGATFPINSNWNILPQFLIKQVDNAPFDLDFSLMLQYMERIDFGLNYRHGGNEDGVGESIDILAAFQVYPNFLFGLSYDITLSDIRSYQDGSLELLLNYKIQPMNQKEQIINPRYF